MNFVLTAAVDPVARDEAVGKHAIEGFSANAVRQNCGAILIQTHDRMLDARTLGSALDRTSLQENKVPMPGPSVSVVPTKAPSEFSYRVSETSASN